MSVLLGALALVASAASTGISVGAYTVAQSEPAPISEAAAEEISADTVAEGDAADDTATPGTDAAPGDTSVPGTLSYRLASALGTEHKFISISPIAAGVVAGVRSVPYYTPTSTAKDKHLLFRTGDSTPERYMAFTNHASNVQAKDIWLQETDSDVLYDRTFRSFSGTIYDDYVALYDGATTYSFRRENTTAFKLYSHTASTEVTLATVSPVSAGFQGFTDACFIGTGKIAYINKYQSASFNIYCYEVSPSSVVVTATVLTLAGYSTGDKVAIFPTETEGVFRVVICFSNGFFIRHTITWDGTTNAPTITSTLTSIALNFNGGSITSKGDIIAMSDGQCVMAGRMIDLTVGIVTFNFVDNVVEDVIAPDQSAQGPKNIRFLAHDPTDDTFFVSFVEDVNVLNIIYCQWDSTNKKIKAFDQVILRGRNGCATNAVLVDKITGKYMFMNYWGQLFPVWVSPTKKTINFSPSVGRTSIGFTTTDGEVHSSGAVVDLPIEVAATLQGSSNIFSTEDGVPTTDSDKGKRTVVATFLGEGDRLIIAPPVL